MSEVSAPSDPLELASKRPDRDRSTERPEPPDPADLSPGQAARRQRIIDTGIRLLEQHDHDDIQMRDVADHASVALATVYRYFASKEHLFAAVLLDWGSGLRARVDRSPLTGDGVAERLDDVYGRVIDAFERFPRFFRLMSLMETTTDVHAHRLFEEFNAEARGTLALPIGGHDADGSPGVATDIAHLLMAVLSAALRSWSTGSIDIETARFRVRRAIELVFSPPPSL